MSHSDLGQVWKHVVLEDVNQEEAYPMLVQ